MTTGKIDIFERGAYKAKTLNFALRFFRNNETTLRDSFDRTKAEGRGPPVDSFDEFTKILLQAVVYGELALFWSAFEGYMSAIYGRTNGFNEARVRCPSFRAPCHRVHKQVHVITILKAVRDRELHGLPAFNEYDEGFACDRTPDEIMLQTVRVRDFDDRRDVLLFGGMTKEEQESIHATPTSERYKHYELTTLGEFLVDEATECIRMFDLISSPTGAFLEGKATPARKPYVFLQSP